MYHIEKRHWISKKENGSNYSVILIHLAWLVNWTCWARCVHFSMGNCKMTYRKMVLTFKQWGLLLGRRHRRKLRILKYKWQVWAWDVSWWPRIEGCLCKETLNKSRKRNCLFVHAYHIDAASSYSTYMFKKSVWKWQRKQPQISAFETKFQELQVLYKKDQKMIWFSPAVHCKGGRFVTVEDWIIPARDWVRSSGWSEA